MKKVHFFGFLFAFTVSFAICSCSPDTDNDGIADSEDKCPKVSAETKDGCPIKKEISKIHVFIDNSASMAGYFSKDAEFNRIISDLTAKVDKQIKPVDIFFIADKTIKYNSSTEQFSNDIATTNFADQKSSQLNEIIKSIASQTGANDISLLVSDCILSFPDDKIKEDNEVNKNAAPYALKNNVFNSFSDLKKKGIATSIYAFKSKFYGTYYDYQNVKTNIPGDYRPFYVWVIGKKELLVGFNNKLDSISSFKPEQYLHFGFAEDPITEYSIIPQLQRKGVWKKEKGETGDAGISEIEFEKKQPVQLSLVVNLDKLPAYARNEAYLNSNLKLTPRGCTATYEIKNKASVDQSRLKNNSQIEAFVDATNVIVITVNSMSLNEANIHLNLPLRYDDWFMRWSTMDDKKIASSSRQTFAFEHLINGVIEAYNTGNKNYIDLNINLKK